MWLLIVVLRVLAMQAGLLMLEVGVVRRKNSRLTIVKNIIDQFVVAIVFYAIGFPVSQGGQGGMSGGASNIFDLMFEEVDYGKWLMGYCFCNATCTIVSGAIAERCILETYVCFAFIMSSVIYPVLSCWCWGGGWLQKLGFHDFAGAGAVHLTAGLSGMIGTLILGPRLGFFRNKKND